MRSHGRRRAAKSYGGLRLSPSLREAREPLDPGGLVPGSSRNGVRDLPAPLLSALALAAAIGLHLKTRDAVISVLGATALHVVLSTLWHA
ncbi:hypothetical protein GCM10018965_010740 [Nonomuraea roseola]